MSSIKLKGDTSGSVTLSAPATGSDVTLTLPAAAGTAATTAYADSAGGLQLITTQTFSAVSSVSLNNVFTATYSNYKLLINLTISTNTDLTMRLRVSGSDDTNTTYKRYLAQGSSAPAFATFLSSNASTVFILSSGEQNAVTCDVFNPQATAITRVVHNASWNVAAGNAGIMFGAGVFNATTAFDGFTLLPNAGTITGTVRIYGYKNGA